MNEPDKFVLSFLDGIIVVVIELSLLLFMDNKKNPQILQCIISKGIHSFYSVLSKMSSFQLENMKNKEMNV